MIVSCAPNPFKNISTDGFTYKETHIYYMGELCATLSAVELAYDDGKIVKEATFVLTDSKFNDKALHIIKLAKSAKPSMEFEVELKNVN